MLAVLLLLGPARASAQEAVPVAEPSPPSGPAAAEASPPTEATPRSPDASEGDVSPLVPSWEEQRMSPRRVTDQIAYAPGDGLEIESEDGEFGMTARVRLQVLGTTAWDDGAEPSLGFELRRARLSFQGRFFGEDNRYKLELALSPQDEGIRDNVGDLVADEAGPRLTPLLDFYFEFRQLRDLSVRVGQYKVPFNRQRVISSGDLQMVDRSLVNAEFNLDRDVGFDLRSPDLFGLGFLRYYAGVYVGRGRDAVGLDDFGLFYLARVEVLPFGMFEDYEEADFERSLRPRLSLGFAYAYLDRARRDRGIVGQIPADEGTTDMHVIDADLIFKLAGLSVMSEFMWREADRNPGAAAAAVAARDGWGFMAQAGYLVPHQPVEVSARYGLVDGRSTGSLSDQSELGLGASWYLGRHAFKVQADYFRLWSDAFDDGEHRIRVQLQGSI